MRLLGRVFWMVLLVSGAFFLGASAQAQTTLRYKFKEGEKLTYVMEQKQEMTMNVMGNDVKVTTKLIMDMTWKITAVDQDGTAKITRAIDRIRVTMDHPALGKTEFDSKDGKEPEDEAGKAVTTIFKALAGSEFTMTMSARGEISDVQMPKKVLDVLKDAGPAGGSFSPDNLKQMAGQVGLVLPKAAVKKGDTWNQQKIECKMEPFGKIVLDTKATFDGDATNDGKKLDQIILKPTLIIEPTPDAPGKVALKKQDAKGMASFDGEKGQLVESTMDQDMEMEISLSDGQTVSTKMKQTVVLKLVPAKYKRPV